VVSAVLDALATLPGPLLLAVVGAAAVLWSDLLVVALGVPVGLVVATRQRRRTEVVAAAA
jgi:hypothetical protein